MGLFSKKVKKDYEILEFNKEELNKRIYQLRSELYSQRNSESHKNLVHFIQELRNLEIINLAS